MRLKGLGGNIGRTIRTITNAEEMKERRARVRVNTNKVIVVVSASKER